MSSNVSSFLITLAAVKDGWQTGLFDPVDHHWIGEPQQFYAAQVVSAYVQRKIESGGQLSQKSYHIWEQIQETITSQKLLALNNFKSLFG